METKNLTIETLSPIFIWKGEDYSKFDYTVEMEGEISIKIYDVNKLINDLPKYIKNKDKLFEILDNIERAMKEGKSFDIITYLRDVDVKIPEKKYLIREYKTRIKDFLNKRDIKPFINQFSNGELQYYIPGSSIKGAINTALLYDKLKDLDEYVFKEMINEIKNKHKRNKGKGIYLQPNKNIEIKINNKKEQINLNVSKEENKYFISDADVDSRMLDIFVAQRFYVYHIDEDKIGDFKRHEKNKNIIIKIYVEGLKPNQTINLKIKCNDEMFNKIREACNELSLKICEWELNLLDEYKKKGKIKSVYDDLSVYDELIEFYENLLNNIENSNNAFFLNIGWGGGYLPKTLYLLAKEKGISFNDVKVFLNTKHKKDIGDYKEFPFTRTITKCYVPKKGLVYYPFGWIKIEW